MEGSTVTECQIKLDTVDFDASIAASTEKLDALQAKADKIKATLTECETLLNAINRTGDDYVPGKIRFEPTVIVGSVTDLLQMNSKLISPSLMEGLTKFISGMQNSETPIFTPREEAQAAAQPEEKKESNITIPLA